jgi:hypothetical protein
LALAALELLLAQQMQQTEIIQSFRHLLLQAVEQVVHIKEITQHLVALVVAEDTPQTVRLELLGKVLLEETMLVAVHRPDMVVAAVVVLAL